MASAPTTLTHQLISASAGSGKTYQLVRRYLHLLALGQPAEGVAAMTFTRKAAGEFFSRILQGLAAMAEKPETAARFFEGVQPPLPPGQDFGLLLRTVARRLHRLQLSTLDSFFAKVAACFPMELGLPAGARVMDEDETRMARREALDALLDRLYLEDQNTALQTLMEAYKQATFGSEDKTVEATLQDWLADGLTLWEDSAVTPASAEEPQTGEAGALWGAGSRGWGSPREIWPQPLQAGDLMAAIEEVRSTFEPLNDAGHDLLEETLTAVLETVPGMPLPKRVKELLEKVQDKDNWQDLVGGNAELMWMRKKTPVTGAAARALVKLVRTLMSREFLVRAGRTRGVAEVMRMLEAEYAKKVKSRGRLSFADVQRLLSQAVSGAAWTAGQEDLWFRLDSRNRHWLLDEFQDTSRVQWKVVGGLVDEVIQDTSGDRSYFAVGDPKQSIYLWRQAEPDLFDDILRGYPARGGEGLHLASLSQSWRSAQPVLDAVNAVFGSRPALEAVLPAGTLKGFAFETHTAAHAGLSGHAALISPADSLDVEEPVWHMTAELLDQVRPLARGWTCAILVRSNREATELTDFLRAATGMEVVCESDLRPCLDNGVTLALMSVLKLAAHPGDVQAREHLRMTPLWVEMEKNGKGWRYTAAGVLSLVFEEGFAGFMEEWTPAVREVCPHLDEFHVRRLAQMADIAAEFDTTGSRDIDAFLEFAREYPLRIRGGARAVQVMTVHASKGLEFDMVILPSLDGSSMDMARSEEYLVSRDGSGVRWVLQTPPRAYVQLDSVLSGELKENKRRTAFESLCRLYVAMTRAKRGLYFIADKPPAKGTALKESRLLRELLGRTGQRPLTAAEDSVVEWETGLPEWFLERAEETAVLAAPEPAAAQEALGKLLRRTQPMPRRKTPSGEESFKVPGSALFGGGREPGRRLGTLVHELFAEVEWTPDLDVLRQQWLVKGLLDEAEMLQEEGPAAEALAMVTGVLSSPACAAAFARPGPDAVVWRERSFDLMLAGEWISGTFDRVVLKRDASGLCTGAWVVDFKTDDLSGGDAALAEKLEGYGPQIALYRQAISRLAGVPAEHVRCSLLFTRACRLVDL